jgi:hypothetical protein
MPNIADITDSGLVHLGTLRALQQLRLRSVTDRGLSVLVGQGLPLRDLRLNFCTLLTNSCVISLSSAALPRLESLDLSWTNISSFQGLDQIKRLSLQGCSCLCESSVDELTRLSRLEELDILHARIGAQRLAAVVKKLRLGPWQAEPLRSSTLKELELDVVCPRRYESPENLARGLREAMPGCLVNVSVE